MVQTVAVDSLAGGGETSYGYGASRRQATATIDIRRGRQPASTPVSTDAAAAPARVEPTRERPDWLEQERVGPPYEAQGRWYVPTVEPGYEQTGAASWYGEDFHGRPTASGEPFDQDALTAAHPTLPIPSLVQITNLENGREAIVRVNDRGPFVGQRLIDVSRRTADVLGFTESGHARVHVRYLGPAPRRVTADGTPAPESTRLPAAPMPSAPVAVVEQGPSSLLPPPAPAADDELAGGLSATPVAYAPPATGGFVVQVGAYADLSNAHRVRASVSQVGPVAVDVRQTAGGELFRVRVGPWRSREEAETAQRTLASLGYPEAVVAAR